MSVSDDPRTRRRADTGSRRPTDTTGCTDPIGWEARALAQVRSHVREVSGPTAAQAGWETDTITRLEEYFDRGDV